MKNLNLLIILSILIIFSSCKFEKNNDSNTDVEFKESELLGQWIRINKMEKLENSEEVIVSKFNLKKNYTAEIEILDSIGYKTITGSWEIDGEQKIGPISFKSDVALTFDKDANHRNIILLSVEEFNKKMILTTQTVKYEKE